MPWERSSAISETGRIIEVEAMKAENANGNTKENYENCGLPVDYKCVANDNSNGHDAHDG